MTLTKKTPRIFSYTQYIDCVLYLKCIYVLCKNFEIYILFTFYYRNHLTSVYEKQTEAEEIFYQPIIKQGSRADNSPLELDMTWSFDIHSLNDMQSLRKKL